MKSLFVLLLFVALTQAAIQWPFKNPNSGANRHSYKITDLGYTVVEAYIGTPAQKINLALFFYERCAGLTVPNASVGLDGFDPDNSSTWINIGKTADGNGYTGTDNFVIYDAKKKPQNLQQAPFNIMDDGFCSSRSTLALTYTTETSKNGFLDSLLAKEKDKVVVFTYDNVSETLNDGFTGNLTIGGYPKTCSNWHKVNEIGADTGLQWQFKMDKVSAGKFSASDPGPVSLNIDTPLFGLSYGTFHQIGRELGVHGGHVPCNSTNDIVFRINGFDLHLTPDQYMDRSDSDDEYCRFFGLENEGDVFQLPVTIYEKYCLLLDFENMMIGFGDLKK